MFEKFLRFFVINQKLNYFLFISLIGVGIYEYSALPKEIFPAYETNKINISGFYPGGSVDTLNKIAVIDIENSISSVEGVESVETTIKPSRFSITAELADDTNKNDALNTIKNDILKIKQNLPPDMNEPIAQIVTRSTPLMNLILSTPGHTRDDGIKVADEVKTQLLLIPNIASAQIFGDSDENMLVKLDDAKIRLYGLSPEDVAFAIKQLSYTFPLGKIEEHGKHYFLSSFNGKKTQEELSDTLIKINNKKLYLSDITTIERKLKDSTTLSTYNGVNSLLLRINKSETGDSILISQLIKKYVTSFNAEHDKEYHIDISFDTSKQIKGQLSLVGTNIIFSIILVGLALWILINKRISIVVSIGIPTAFLIGFIFFDWSGTSINMVSLLGILIAVGLLVDDAIVVTENIQRHVSLGLSPIEASVKGTSEVAFPIFMASLTTLFAFFPMFMLSGDIGNFMKMIPITVIALIIASIIESFVFLPLHAAHTLHKDDHETDWTPAENFYKKAINFVLSWKKSFLFLFIIIVPSLTVITMKQSKFQFFPVFDSDVIYISGKINLNSKTEDTLTLVKKLEGEIATIKDTLSVKSTTGMSGFRMNKKASMDFDSNLFYITIDLHRKSPTGLMEKYVDPIMNFSFNFNPDAPRTMSSADVAASLEARIPILMKKYPEIDEIEIIQDKPTIVKSDIQLELSSRNQDKMTDSLKLIRTELSKINGVVGISDNAALGASEIKVQVNAFGENLGLTESYISRTLSDNFLSNRKSSYFNTDGLFDVIIENKEKDHLEALTDLIVTIPGTNQKVALRDVATFSFIDNFEKFEKINGRPIKTVFASVDTTKITASEVVLELKPLITKIEATGVKVSVKGENEKKETLIKDVTRAMAVSLILIFIILLFMFNSFFMSLSILSIIPLSLFGVLIGHFIVGVNLTMPSIIGIMGLAGVVINDAIIMLDFLQHAKTFEDALSKAQQRLRPIILTSATTFIGLFTLMFFASGRAAILQPLAISLGFGIAWGTLLNLFFIPLVFILTKKLHKKRKKDILP